MMDDKQVFVAYQSRLILLLSYVRGIPKSVITEQSLLLITASTVLLETVLNLSSMTIFNR